MTHLYKLLGLLLLLLTAQQGAVVHELSHVGVSPAGHVRVDSSHASEAACALCPAFAQAATPGFSHSFHLPPLDRVPPQLLSAAQFTAIDAPVPQARSRGPPRLS